MESNNLEFDEEYEKLKEIYDECLKYLNSNRSDSEDTISVDDPDYETIKDNKEPDEKNEESDFEVENEDIVPKTVFKLENEKPRGSIDSVISEPRSERLRRLSQQLPKIIITNSSTSLDLRRPEDFKFIPRGKSENNIGPKMNNNQSDQINNLLSISNTKKMNNNIISTSMANMNNVSKVNPFGHTAPAQKKRTLAKNGYCHSSPPRSRPGYGDHPKRLVSKNGMENVALISNVPFEKIRLLNDTFHTLINLRWRWIVIGTVVVHFAIWLVFAVFWYITALAHYDFEPDPPKKTCITGGTDFVTIFLASVEAQTTIGFGDRAIDEECPESIFLFLMQLILGTGLSGVLTCVVYAKLTRPEKLSRDGVGFSKRAVISMRDGHLCLMIRAWDLNYDHIISSEFTAHFVNTHRTKEGEVIRYYAQTLSLQEKQFLLWPVTLVHVIDASSPLYGYTPELIANNSYEITVSLKGASASMGTFTQSQTSYLPKEVIWGHRFLPVVKYDIRKQKYVIDHTKLDVLEPVHTPTCSAKDLHKTSRPVTPECPSTPGTPGSFSDQVAAFQLERSSSFRKKTKLVS